MASLAAGPFVAACASGSRVVELHIASMGDELMLQPDHLTCPTGVRVKLYFHHAGEIVDDPHDWVLLKPGMEKAFLADADMQMDEAVVIPPNDKDMVLAATPLCPRGKTVSVEFIAPPPGDYVFLCSVAGHGETMHGILTVTA